MNIDLDSTCFLAPEERIPLPQSFDLEGFMETEKELNMLFPETEGRRVNFAQFGLTAWILVESYNEGDLECDETYVLTPCCDDVGFKYMRPIRMVMHRRLTLSEYRMAHLTAIKLMGKVAEAGEAMRSIGESILGEEVIAEVSYQMRELDQE